MRKVLIFVASGFSTRMGGFPKGLALVNGKPVIANAIDCAIPYYDDIYVICNFKTESHFQKVLLNGVKMSIFVQLLQARVMPSLS